MKKFELTLSDKTEGLTAISLVNDPAVEEVFVKMSKDKNIVPIKMSADDEEKRIVTAPAMIPNKMIYRDKSWNGEECEVFFSKETIFEASKLFMMGNNLDNTTINHAFATDDAALIENWIVVDPNNDKANALGFDVPEGTLLMSYQIKSDKLWDAIKDGDINGFSIEAYFASQLIEASKTSPEYTEEEREELLTFMGDLASGVIKTE